ncbi:MAG: FKBP-type peptidyl-prolyl cis-trans isomerase [Candidatus Saccharimonas sp.]
MAKSKVQRWGILVILIVTVIGTLGSFAVMVLASRDDTKQQKQRNDAMAKYQTAQQEYQKKVDAQGDELSAKYYETFKQYSPQVASYDIANATALSTEDLVIGDGEEITGETKFATYYIGWDANGRVFDQSIDTTNNKLKAPFSISSGLDNTSVIEGWKEGIKGMKIGGVRLLTIPSDKAYGEAGSKDASGNETIAPNMPLKFVVMAIPMPAEVEQPDMTEILKYLGS